MVTSAPLSGGQICEMFKRPGGRTHLGVLPITAGKSGSVGFLERLSGEGAAHHYAAIIESPADAILSKDLNGVITSVSQLVESAGGRLSALARALALTVSHGSSDVAQIARRASLHSLIETS
jgi:hypothetical protein